MKIEKNAWKGWVTSELYYEYLIYWKLYMLTALGNFKLNLSHLLNLFSLICLLNGQVRKKLNLFYAHWENNFVWLKIQLTTFLLGLFVGLTLFFYLFLF